MGGYLHQLTVAGWEDVSERNLSSDPEAAFVVLNAPPQQASRPAYQPALAGASRSGGDRRDGVCPITLMNAHVCLQAPFGLPELAPIEGFDPKAHRILRDYLLTCETTHRAPRDYLWDLLPAVYISYPELFDYSPVRVRSTPADLETGTIVVGDDGDGALINMPTRILDVDRFYRILYDAWARAPLKGR